MVQTIRKIPNKSSHK